MRNSIAGLFAGLVVVVAGVALASPARAGGGEEC